MRLTIAAAGHNINHMVEHNSFRLDQVFRALSDPTRRAMLRRLSARERSVGELAEPLDMSLAAASKHIQVLERAGLVEREIQGRIHVCRLSAEPLAHVQDWLRYYERFWNQRLDALEGLLHAEDAAAAKKPRRRKQKR